MNNSPSSTSSSSSSTNTKNTNDDTLSVKPSTTHILDVMFDYAASGDDELTLRFEADGRMDVGIRFYFLSLSVDVVVN